MYSGNKPGRPAQMIAFLRGNCRQDGECLIWSGAMDAGGPRVMWNRKSYRARRLLLQLVGRLEDKSLWVWDTCGNPRCMREAHLRVGSIAEARAAKAAQNRYQHGAPHSIAIARGRSKAARCGRKEIERVLALRAEGQTYRQIAALYGVSASAVQKMVAAWARMVTQNVSRRSWGEP